MALRFVLVSLVATLGFDLPNGADLARLARSGQTWAVAQWQEWKAIVAEDGEALAAAPSLTHEEAPDEADAASPTLAAAPEDSAFHHEVRLPDFAEARTMRGDSSTIEVIEEEAAENLVATEADVLDDERFSELLNAMVAEISTEPAEALAATDDAAPSIRGDKAAEELANESTTTPGSEAARLATAVRLTGQAVQAWMSVLQQTTPQGFGRP